MANNNSINGSFTTLSVSSIREVTTNTGEIVTAGGYINMNNDGILELHGKDLYINFRENTEIRNDGSIVLKTTTGDLEFTSETGRILLDSGAPGTTSIYIKTNNSGGGILMESGTSGINILSQMGDISIISKGKDINIGYSDGLTAFDPTNETQNINIEAQSFVNVNASSFQVTATGAESKDGMAALPFAFHHS